MREIAPAFTFQLSPQRQLAAAPGVFTFGVRRHVAALAQAQRVASNRRQPTGANGVREQAPALQRLGLLS
mgnify:CR=1 FL=1